jgi:transcriptional regulator with XRE-family HTH domain
MPTLGEKLRTLRKERGYTLDGLAEEVGISKSYLWELENRTSPNPSVEKLSAIAAKLGVGIGYFLDVQETQPRQAHLDEAFFRNYKALPPEDQAKFRAMMDAFRKHS